MLFEPYARFHSFSKVRVTVWPVATISVHQRLLFTMNKSRCGRNDFCPLDSNR